MKETVIKTHGKNYSNVFQNLLFGINLEATKRRAGTVDRHTWRTPTSCLHAL